MSGLVSFRTLIFMWVCVLFFMKVTFDSLFSGVIIAHRYSYLWLQARNTKLCICMNERAYANKLGLRFAITAAQFIDF